jgi:hypothetical protein
MSQQKKSNTPGIDRRTAANMTVTRKDALMLFQAIQEASDEGATVDILGHIDDVMDNAPSSDPASNKELFLKFFLEGWPESGTHTRRNVGEIIQRVRAGQSIEEIYAHFQQEQAKASAEKAEKERNAPEPKNWLSSEWRHWKIRQLTRALTGDDSEAYNAAWEEYQKLLRALVADEDFYHTSFALALLPHLLVARQDIAQILGQKKDKRRKPEYLKARKGVTR